MLRTGILERTRVDRRSVALVLGAIVVAGTSGCQTKMMPTPVVFETGDPDPFAGMPPDERTSTISVFYATDRNQTDDADPAKAYGKERGIVLRLGTARVQMGAEGSTWDEVIEAARRGNPPALRVVDVEEIGPLWTTVPGRDRAAIDAGWDPARRSDPERQAAYSFVEAIDEKLARSRSGDVVVYVPGINTDFARPVVMTSALSHYMGEDSVFIAYCWPSSGSFLDYGRDTETVALTVRNLRDLLLLLSAETSVRRIHVVSYSRGAAVVNGALTQLRLIHAFDDAATMRAARKLGTIVYAGPDEDLLVFKGLFLDQLDDLFESIIIYSSPRDFALQLSGSLMSGTERLGRPGAGFDETTIENLRKEWVSAFIDVEYAQKRAGAGGAGHSFWYDNSWVSSDLITALEHGLPPAERGLIRAEDGAKWTFPEDYPERIRAIVTAREQRAYASPAP